MGTANFSLGTQVLIKHVPYKLFRKIGKDLWQLEEVRTRRIVEMDLNHLKDLYREGELIFTASEKKAATYSKTNLNKLVNSDSEETKKAKIRRSYVMEIINLPANKIIIEPVIQKLWEKLRAPEKKPSASAVLHWKKKFVKSGQDIRALISDHLSKGNREPRYPEKVIEFVSTAIDEIYLTRERRTVEDTFQQAVLLTLQENQLRPTAHELPLPSKKLVGRLIANIPAYDRDVARYGKTEAERRYRSVQGHRYASAPLDRAEIDHNLMDLFVIDDKTGMPLGRPWLTACIDVNSRVILGIYKL